MLTITKKLDMSPHGVPQVIRVSQYDSDFTLEFKLFASGGNFAISTGTTAEIRGTKQSGTGYSASATLDTSTKVVTVAGAAQMTAVAGMNIFEIVLKKDNKEISSANFCLMVERAALDADTITDESVLKELNAIIESADTVTQAAEEAEAAADRAEAAAQLLVTDPTLTQRGQAADAKATGDAISGLTDAIAAIGSGLSEDAKEALLACFRHVAWTDEHGQDYYNALASALYSETYPKIVADFNPGVNVIYTDDELSTLKQYLTVRYFEDASDAGTIVPANNYALSGMLTTGTNTIIVTYNNLTSVFTVNGVVDFYNIYTWIMGGNAIKAIGGTDPNVDAVPSRIKIYATDNDNYSTRRTLVVNHGKAPFYQYDSDKTSGSNYHATNYYPIPVPLTANHIKITTGSTPLDIYAHFVPYNSSNNSYDNSPWSGNRITWTTFPASKIIEKDIVQDENGKQLFVLLNMRYTSSSTFPTEPTGVKIEFSEV